MMTRQEENKRNSRILKAIKNMCEKHIADGTIGDVFDYNETYQHFTKNARLYRDKDDIQIQVSFKAINKDIIVYDIWLSNTLEYPDCKYYTLKGSECEEIYRLLIDNIHLFTSDYNSWDDKDFYSKFLSEYESI